MPFFCFLYSDPDFLYTAPDATAYAAFVKESRKKPAGATKLHGKFGWIISSRSVIHREQAPMSYTPIGGNFMPKPIAGLHHVTAIASDPQRNLDFYTEVLGLRFVKRTINFDDPGTYHFYFGDDAGSPARSLLSSPGRMPHGAAWG